MPNDKSISSGSEVQFSKMEFKCGYDWIGLDQYDVTHAEDAAKLLIEFWFQEAIKNVGIPRYTATEASNGFPPPSSPQIKQAKVISERTIPNQSSVPMLPAPRNSERPQHLSEGKERRRKKKASGLH